jgi:REP element-mobilizing transposase RayT
MGLKRRKNRGRECEPPMPEPLAYFLTWPTYGTWLPGDARGWVQYRRGMQLPDPILEQEASARMTEDACRLDHQQRRVVETTIAQHCRIRGWALHAVNCRSNHLHVVVAANRHPDQIREQFKAWCTRRLKDLERERRLGTSTSATHVDKIRENWWAERGSGMYINDDDGLEALIHYVCEAQDSPPEKHQSDLHTNRKQGGGVVHRY